MACKTEKPVLMRSSSSRKRSLVRGELIIRGGFSLVYFGEIVDEKVPVAIKIIRKEPFLQPLKATRSFFKATSKHMFQLKPLLFKSSETMRLPEKGSLSEDSRMKQPSSESSIDFVMEGDELEEVESEKQEKPPKKMSRRDISQEIRSLKLFQSNSFVLELFGTCSFFRETWIATELCVGDLYSIFEQISSARANVLSLQDQGYMIAHLMAPILCALHFIHEKGFVHRDLKPANILVNNHGVSKLGDFGLCEKLSASNTFKSKDVSGTYFFMAPEVVRMQPIGPKADAFAFALTCANVKYKRLLGHFYEKDWDNIIEAYTIKPHLLDRIQESLTKNISSAPFGRYSGKSWDEFGKDLGSLVSFNLESRGTLTDLAANPVFKQALEDWERYPCAHSDLSSRFLRMHGAIATYFGSEGSDTLKSFTQYFVKPKY